MTPEGNPGKIPKAEPARVTSRERGIFPASTELGLSWRSAKTVGFASKNSTGLPFGDAKTAQCPKEKGLQSGAWTKIWDLNVYFCIWLMFSTTLKNISQLG
jgi:hypothetical protein